MRNVISCFLFQVAADFNCGQLCATREGEKSNSIALGEAVEETKKKAVISTSMQPKSLKILQERTKLYQKEFYYTRNHISVKCDVVCWHSPITIKINS